MYVINYDFLFQHLKYGSPPLYVVCVSTSTLKGEWRKA